MKRSLLLIVVVMILFSLVLCACDNKKKEESNTANTEVVENNENVENEPTELEKIILDNTEENLSKFMVSYNNAKFSTGVQMDLIKELLGQESKPSDTSKACGPYVKGETTHYYYDGLIVDVNYEGKVNGISIESDKAILRSGVKVGMTSEEVKSIIAGANEDEYGLTYYVGEDFYVSMIKADDGTIMIISIGDMSIED